VYSQELAPSPAEEENNDFRDSITSTGIERPCSHHGVA